MNDSIAILIPAFNEERAIRGVVMHCLQFTKNVLVVDDGSSDKTVEVIADLPIEIIKQPANAGKGQALLTGFAYWAGQPVSGVITLDADGQHNPDDLPRFFEKIEKHSTTFIIGSRTVGVEAAPKVRLFANRVADFFVSWAAHKWLKDTQSGFRYYPLHFISTFLQQKNSPDRFAFEVAVLVAAVRAGYDVDYIDIKSCYPEDARASHYQPCKDTWLIIKTVAKLIFKK